MTELKPTFISILLTGYACACSLVPTVSIQPGLAATAEQLMEIREHINKGNLCLGRNQFQQAMDEYEKCLLIDPTNQTAKDNIVLAHNNCGIMFFSQHRFADAQAEWEEALKTNPYDRNVKRNMQILKATIDHMDKPAAAKKTADKSDAQEGDTPNSATASGAVIIKSATKPPANHTVAQPTATASGAVLLSTGNNSKKPDSAASAATGANTSPSPNSDGTYEEIPTYNGGTIRILSGAHANQERPPSASVPPASPSTQAIIISSPHSSPPAAVAPPQTTQIATPPTTPLSPMSYTRADLGATGDTGTATIEQKLDAIELKVYGHTQADAPVFKRLEKLELDTGGSVKPGSVQQRVDTLRHSYGI